MTEVVLSTIEKYKLLPSEIKFAHKQAYEVVQSIAESLGFKITLSNNLKAIRRFKTGLHRQSEMGFPDLPE